MPLILRRLTRDLLECISWVLSLLKYLIPFQLRSRVNSEKIMAQRSTKEINLQADSPLFNYIPPEIRNNIFKFALTAYEDPTRKYRRNAYYYRPGYTCAHKIDTNLLLTCRLVYAETAHLPASINEHVSWHYRAPPGIEKRAFQIDDTPASLLRRRELRKIHIFAQQYWLEAGDRGFGGFTRLWTVMCPINLKITIRHTDWWCWEIDAPLALDPKRAGRPSAQKHSRPCDPFEPGSWGSAFRRIRGLRCLQLELETVESKKTELDAIVGRANEWQFPLGDDHILIPDQSKIKRTGWIGEYIGECRR